MESVTIDKPGSVVGGSNNEASRYVLEDVNFHLSYGVVVDVNVQPVKENGGSGECPSSQRKTATNLKTKNRSGGDTFIKMRKSSLKSTKCNITGSYIYICKAHCHAWKEVTGDDKQKIHKDVVWSIPQGERMIFVRMSVDVMTKREKKCV